MKTVSITRIAKEVGVSHATVSIILNSGRKNHRISQACAERIRKVATRLGYVPNYHAQAMKSGRAGVIGVAMDVKSQEFSDGSKPSSTQIGGTYFGTLIGAIELYTRAHACLTTIIGPSKNANALDHGLQALRQRQLDGLIILGAAVDPSSPCFIKKTLQEPMVAIEYSKPARLPVVNWDEAAGVALMVKHLAALGHKEILWLSPSLDDGCKDTLQRERIFMKAVLNAGLRCSACHLPVMDLESFSHAVEVIGKKLPAHIKGKGFTAIAGYNDVMAIGAYRALQKLGLRVPADISVIGIDDIVAPLASPPLTTVSHKLYEIGHRAVQLLFEMIENKKSMKRLQSRREMMTPELVIRDSTGPARSRKIGKETI